MIVTIAHEKGGVQTPLLAHNLAALRAMDRHQVLLVDTHPQKYSLSWSEACRVAGVEPNVPARFINGKALQPELENVTLRYSDIFIDTEGRDSQASRSALAAACVAVIPVFPCFMTQAAQDRLVSRIQHARRNKADPRVLFVLTGVRDDPSFEYMTAVRALVARIPWASLAESVIHHAASLDHSYEKGLAVCESKPADGMAIGEMSSLYREIYKKYQRPSHMPRPFAGYLHAA